MALRFVYFLYGISSVNAASNRRARGAIGVQRIDERQHIADRALALGRSAPRLLLMPALCALSGRLFLLRRLLRKGGAGRFRVMHPVCIVARYVAEILQQAPEADVLVVIAANGGRCVRSAKLCVFVVQHIDRKIGGTGAQMPTAEPSAGQDTVTIEFTPYKPKIRKPGTGCVTMINDHLYEGRYTPTNAYGKRESHNIYAKTREECEEKLAKMIAEVKAQIKAEKEKMTG